jgi:hypothetical protein
MYVHVCIYIYIYTYVYIYVYIYMYILAIDAANNIRKQPAFDILVSKQDATNFTLKYCSKGSNPLYLLILTSDPNS